MTEAGQLPLDERAAWALGRARLPWTTSRDDDGALEVEDADSYSLIKRFHGYVSAREVEAVGMLPGLVQELLGELQRLQDQVRALGGPGGTRPRSGTEATADEHWEALNRELRWHAEHELDQHARWEVPGAPDVHSRVWVRLGRRDPALPSPARRIEGDHPWTGECAECGDRRSVTRMSIIDPAVMVGLCCCDPSHQHTAESTIRRVQEQQADVTEGPT